MFYYWEGVGESGEWRRCVLLLVGPREVVPAREELRLDRPTERTPRPHKGSGGGMFFASCSSSSSAIVAAGVQRPAATGSRLFAAEGRYQSCFGCRPAVYCSQFIYEHEWGCPCARTQRFLQKCDGTGRSKPEPVCG